MLRVFIAGNPISGLCRFLITKISSLTTLVSSCKVAVNWPHTLSDFFAGPCSTPYGDLSNPLKGVAADSEMTVIFAPVSILNVMGIPLSNSSIVHSPLLVEFMAPKNSLSFPSAGCSFVTELTASTGNKNVFFSYIDGKLDLWLDSFVMGVMGSSHI